MQTLYNILGISERATSEEIKFAFRNLAREIHPDTATDKTDAENHFKEVSHAYSILSNKRERLRYDRAEIDEQGWPVRRSGFSRSSRGNPYEKFNKRHHRNSKAETRNIRIDGSDVFYVLQVDFLDAVNGAIKHISMTNGRRVRVSIPRGTKQKQMLRLRGQGVPGVGGGKDGAAIVEILIKDHSLFHIEGNDIVIEQPVGLKLAVLGGPLEVPCCDGEPATIQIPKNASSGTMMRLHGKGMMAPDGVDGDQVIRLLVVLPENGDSELTRLMENWDPPEADIDGLDDMSNSATA